LKRSGLPELKKALLQAARSLTEQLGGKSPAL
jgi:hypothetical protein